ncbi:hypothetical protein LBWT_X0360 (plasmid) [Leptolyngbya boryana IAM M-101]|nr:hypothetical protein LBWT_X0360 [Leptolyngbya boryana IAM M-101]BAS66312.1 hypothetical protein LBDG_X0360 [Leptolyngbya boryana dg5]
MNLRSWFVKTEKTRLTLVLDLAISCEICLFDQIIYTPW